MLASIPGYTAIHVILSSLAVGAGLLMLYRRLEPTYRFGLATIFLVVSLFATLPGLASLSFPFSLLTSSACSRRSAYCFRTETG
jgi:hypothetical protein